MQLCDVLKAPDATIPIVVDWATYKAADALSGIVWSVPTGLAVVGTPTLVAELATVLISGGQEGVDYQVKCAATFASGAVEIGNTLVQCRSGVADPRLG